MTYKTAAITELGDSMKAECMYPFGGGSSGQSVMRSTHTGGIFVAMADASVRFISECQNPGRALDAT